MKQGIIVFISIAWLACLSSAIAATTVAIQSVPSAPTLLSLSGDRSQGFMTSRDLLNTTPSGITIKNVSTGTLALSGIYIQTLYSTDGPVSANYDIALGALWSTVSLNAGSTTSVGANFLYNMIMNYGWQATVFNQTGLNNVTPGSTLSGTPWLVFLGVVKGVQVTPTATISASNDLVYIDYNSPYTSYGQQICVACNDATQLCTTTSSCYHGQTTSSTEQDVPCNLDGATGCAAGVYPPN